MTRSTVPHDPSGPDRVRDTAFEVLVRKEETDDRALRRALGLAAAAHLLLFGIHFPDWSRPAMAEPTKEIAYVLKTPIFTPKPEPPPEIPERRVRKVPIPDPTPDAPEPIRDPADSEAPLDLDLPPVTWIVPEAPPEAPESGPVQYRSEMERPRRIHDPAPAYTEAARKAGIEGVVILEAILDEEGRVTNVRIAKDLPLGLGESAARAVREWRFTPATLNGEPIAVYYHLSVNFGIR